MNLLFNKISFLLISKKIFLIEKIIKNIFDEELSCNFCISERIKYNSGNSLEL